MDLAKLRALFVGECEEILGRLEQATLALEKSASDENNLRDIFQALHTLKGNSATMGFDKMAELAHHLEDALDDVKNGKAPFTPKSAQLLLDSLDIFRALVKEFQEEKDTINIDEFLAHLKNFSSEEAAPSTTPTLVPQASQSQTEVPQEISHQTSAAPSPPTQKPESEPMPLPEAISFSIQPTESQPPPAPANPALSPMEASQSQQETRGETAVLTAEKAEQQPAHSDTLSKMTVRVQLSHLDAMMNLVGELAISKSRLIQYSKELGASALEAEVKFVERLSGQLQEEVLQTRLVPVDDIFQRYGRVVRDVSHELKKEVNFIIQDNGISVDRVLFEKINEAVVHLLRNAIDHGIESKEARLAAGKNPAATLSLVARKEKGYAVIDVIDDGGGIDVNKVKNKALSMGIITPEAAAKMEDQEALYLICRPNLSTKEEITQYSGRGVGMDAVQESVESVNGHLEIESTLGKGSRFSLFLPLNLAIVQALLFVVGEQTFAIPLSDVVELISLENIKPIVIDKKEVVVLRNEVLPLARLRDIFRIKAQQLVSNGRVLDEHALIVHSRKSKFALAVDHLLGRQEIVLKNLTGFLKQLQGIGGASILGDGRAILILDVQEGYL